MPNYVHHTFEGGGIAIWYITETSDELYALLDTHRYDEPLSERRCESRRAEWLAVRQLVKELFGSEVEVAYHSTGRPYLKGSAIHISISHTQGYAAVAYHRHSPIGVDIERIANRVERIAHRFTSSVEAGYINLHEACIRQGYHLINWSAKETLYKLLDDARMVDFKVAFHIAPYTLHPQGTLAATLLASGNTMVSVHYHFFPDFVCTWALTE